MPKKNKLFPYFILLFWWGCLSTERETHRKNEAKEKIMIALEHSCSHHHCSASHMLTDLSKDTNLPNLHTVQDIVLSLLVAPTQQPTRCQWMWYKNSAKKPVVQLPITLFSQYSGFFGRFFSFRSLRFDPITFLCDSRIYCSKSYIFLRYSI